MYNSKHPEDGPGIILSILCRCKMMPRSIKCAFPLAEHHGDGQCAQCIPRACRSEGNWPEDHRESVFRLAKNFPGNPLSVGSEDFDQRYGLQGPPDSGGTDIRS